MDFHDLNGILLQLLVRMFCFLNNENPSRIAEVSPEKIEFSGNYFANLLPQFLMDFHDLNIGQNILVVGNFYGIANFVGIYK